ncbi:hypothetical protein CRG98_003312 [Punica granatum]|uniref:Uncharacterized protein n=1 Tax=Punica granatum TaxID=22663 RepID=A0A2I0L855_PUNGR|nr:hypothetical protein CRG98_003312 [Punica granatum]
MGNFALLDVESGLCWDDVVVVATSRLSHARSLLDNCTVRLAGMFQSLCLPGMSRLLVNVIVAWWCYGLAQLLGPRPILSRWRVRTVGGSPIESICSLLCRKSASLLGRPLADLSEADLATGAGKRGRVQLCVVERLSDHDLLITRESEGREGPLRSDGTTCLSRGRRETRLKPEKPLRNPFMCWPGTVGWRLQMLNLTPKMDSGGRIHMGEGLSRPWRGKLRLAWLSLAEPWAPLGLGKSRRKLGSRLATRSISVLARRPRLKIGNRRRPRNLRSELSQCFSSVLMCQEITVFSVCRKRAAKVYWGTFETTLKLLERHWQVVQSERK